MLYPFFLPNFALWSLDGKNANSIMTFIESLTAITDLEIKEQGCPAYYQNEKRLLQNAVDSLIDIGNDKPLVGSGGRPLKC